MRAGRSALRQVIDSVADGSSDIEWERLEQQVGTEHDRQLLRQLRVVSQVSALQRAEMERLDEQALLASANAIRLRTKTLTAEADMGTSQASSEAEARPTLPTRFWGRLQLRERLGEGTFGEVYRAFDPHLEREVAVKLLHVGKPEAMKRVLREARGETYVGVGELLLDLAELDLQANDAKSASTRLATARPILDKVLAPTAPQRARLEALSAAART